jgi:hypothetical protein
MYNTTFLCTYKLHDDEEDQDTLYRHEYLYAFGLKEYDSDAIITLLHDIYEKLKDNKHFIQIAESHYYFSKENKNHELILQFLFSFHTFDLFHKCLVYLLEENNNDNNSSLDNEEFLKNKKILIDEITKK